MENKLTTRQAAELLRRHPDEVKDMAYRGQLPAVKVDGQWWFDWFELHQWQQSNPHQTYKLQGISDEDIARLAEGRTYDEVGRMFGVTGSAIGHHMRRIGKGRYNKNG